MRTAVGAFVAGLLICAPAKAQQFTNSVFGLSIQKPDDWCVLSAEGIAEDHRIISMANPKLGEPILKSTSVLLYAFTRYRGQHRGLTTTVKLEMEPAGSLEGQSGQRALQAMLSSVSNLMPDVKVMTVPEIVTLAGKPAGHMVLTYPLKARSASFRIGAEMWAIPRGKYFLVLSATYPADNTADDRVSVMQIINSLRLTN